MALIASLVASKYDVHAATGSIVLARLSFGGRPTSGCLKFYSQHLGCWRQESEESFMEHRILRYFLIENSSD